MKDDLKKVMPEWKWVVSGVDGQGLGGWRGLCQEKETAQVL